MDSRKFFRVQVPATGMPRRMRWPRWVVSEVGLTALLCAALVGLFMLGASIDEPVDPEIEALAVAERAQLDAVKMCLLAQPSGARP